MATLYLKDKFMESNSKNNTNLFHKKIGDRFLIIPAHEANFTLPPDNITIKLKQ